MHWMGPRGRMGQAATLRLAIDGHALTAPRWDFSGRVRVEKVAQRGGERVRIQAAEEALERGDMGRTVLGKAQRAFDGAGLGGSPLGNCEQGEMVGQDGGDGHGQDGGQREARTLAPPGIGHLGAGGVHRGEGEGKVDAGACWEDGCCARLHDTLLGYDAWVRTAHHNKGACCGISASHSRTQKPCTLRSLAC